MISRTSILIGTCLTILIIFWTVPVPAAAADGDVRRISKEELRAKLNDPAVTVIDVRYKPNWRKSGQKIVGAVREDPNEISAWVGKYKKDQALVFYCD